MTPHLLRLQKVLVHIRTSRQGHTQEFFKGGGLKFWETYFALIKVSTGYLIYYNIYVIYGISSLTRQHFSWPGPAATNDVCFTLPVFTRYRNFVNLLKYDATYCGTSLQNFDIVYGSL